MRKRKRRRGRADSHSLEDRSKINKISHFNSHEQNRILTDEVSLAPIRSHGRNLLLRFTIMRMTMTSMKKRKIWSIICPSIFKGPQQVNLEVKIIKSNMDWRTRDLLTIVSLANLNTPRRTLYKVCLLRIYLNSILEGPRPPRSIETLRIQRGSTCFLKRTIITSSH